MRLVAGNASRRLDCVRPTNTYGGGGAIGRGAVGPATASIWVASSVGGPGFSSTVVQTLRTASDFAARTSAVTMMIGMR